MPISIGCLTMLNLSDFEPYSRWVPLIQVQRYIHFHFCGFNVVSGGILLNVFGVNITHTPDYTIIDDVIFCKILCISL